MSEVRGGSRDKLPYNRGWGGGRETNPMSKKWWLRGCRRAERRYLLYILLYVQDQEGRP